MTDPGRFVFIEGNGALISRAIDQKKSESQCFSIWTFFGGAGKLTVELWSVEPDYGELLGLFYDMTVLHVPCGIP